jgi:hypothetical protein
VKQKQQSALADGLLVLLPYLANWAFNSRSTQLDEQKGDLSSFTLIINASIIRYGSNTSLIFASVINHQIAFTLIFIIA